MHTHDRGLFTTLVSPRRCVVAQGLDTKDSADDRALVDGTVTPRNVIVMVLGYLVVAAGILAYFVSTRGTGLLWLALGGLALALFYSADPIGLKYRGLGDICIFLCFGPLLMEGTSLTLCGRLDYAVLVYSVPIGLLTTCILHANNTRDIDADKAGGAVTLAMALGFDKSYTLYCILLTAVYVVCLINAVVLEFGPRVMLLGFTVPGALSLVNSFRARDLALLPQSTAQFEALFGLVLICAIAPLPFNL